MAGIWSSLPNCGPTTVWSSTCSSRRGRATRVARVPGGRSQTYGLDNPDAVVTLRVKGGRQDPDQVLKVGKPVGRRHRSDDGERFASLNDGKAVLVLPPPLVQGCWRGRLARDRNLVKFADADKAVLDGDRKAVSFARTDGTWKITAPLTTDAEHTELKT
jgi:hypothetical protein